MFLGGAQDALGLRRDDGQHQGRRQSHGQYGHVGTDTWPADTKGVGSAEAPRGALGHWIHIKDTKIENYQAIVPTTWNASPRDPAGQHRCLRGSSAGDADGERRAAAGDPADDSQLRSLSGLREST